MLGNIQQGWNDYSAKTWEETLNGELGERIQESMKKSSKAALEEAIKKEVSTIPGLRSMLNLEDGRTVYQTTDQVGSSHKINAKPEIPPETTPLGKKKYSSATATNIIPKVINRYSFNVFIIILLFYVNLFL